MPVLSVLIPTTPDRQHQFDSLYFKLLKQAINLRINHPSLGEIEILYDDSRKHLEGGISIGEKRQKLIERATGDYLAFIDSDDDVAPCYIELLVRAIFISNERLNIDIITFNAFVKTDPYWAFIEMKFENKLNEQLRPEGIIKRTPWHVCAIKSDIAKTEKFSALNHNEDFDWMQRLLPKISTSYHIDVPLIQYNHSEEGSEADKIFKHQQ